MTNLFSSETNLIKQLAIRLGDKPTPDFILGGDILADHQTVILYRSPSKPKAILGIDQSQQV